MTVSRRTFLKIVGAGAAASLVEWPMLSALASPAAAKAGSENEFFVFIHAAGGWDVTLWADPRNERKGLIDPATTDNTDVGGVNRWEPDAADDATASGARSFKILQPAGSKIPLGPGAGDLVDLFDRITIVNGLAMNTVSHPDGTAFSATGRHLAGGHMAAASIDAVLGSELGREQLLPVVSVQFPSSFMGPRLDARAIPLRVANIGALSRSLQRSQQYDSDADRAEVTAVLSAEAEELATRSIHPDTMDGLAGQYASVPRMLGGDLAATFTQKALQNAHPEFDYKAKYQAQGAVNAAFAVEAMSRNLVRCVAFALGGLDTHNGNYRFHARTQQEIFGLVTTLVKTLDDTPHPTLASHKLSEHTHILVFSDFCRTPQINPTMGRDHYPNNSALVISPRFRANMVYGKSDFEQLLPANAGRFADGMRPVAPPDLLATFLAAVNVDPRPFLRDGEVVKELLKA